MKAAILLNGEPYSGEICADRVYCCDGAYTWAKGRVEIYKNLGDFDSLTELPDPPPTEVYPSEKDFTDGEIALKQAIADGADEVVIYGGFGGRSDHFLGNLQLLYAAHAQGVKCSMVSEKERAFAASGKIIFSGLRGKTVSVLPFGGPLHIMDSAGLKYSYPDEIGYGECRGISNICERDEAFVEVDGVALVIINGGKV